MFYNVKLDTYDPLNSAGWRVATIPTLTHSTHNRNRYSIPARDGELLGVDMWRSNAFVTVTFHTRVGQHNVWNNNFWDDSIDKRYNRLKGFLTNKKRLHIKTQNALDHTQYDDAGYYEILDWVITNETRINRDYMRVEVQFEVYPFKYVEISATNPEYTTATTLENNYDESLPLYYMNRGSSGTVGSWTLTVNGYTMTGTYPAEAANVYIDTRYQIVYYTASNVKYEITGVNGDYKKLRLPAHSQSTISGSSTVETHPRFGENV